MEATPVDGRLAGQVTVLRDGHGVPHIFAENEYDAYFGLGVCMAQDRARQLDWLRRKAAGRLAEAMGGDYLARDVEARTIGFRSIALATLEILSRSSTDVLWAFADGVTAGLADPDLRTAGPVGAASVEAWTPVDTLSVFRAFGWQLSGRLHHILAAELAHLRLPPEDADLFLSAYSGGSSIREPGPPADGVEAGTPGSNNWVVAGGASQTGMPLLASDPHLPPEFPGLFYEARLNWGSTSVAGLCHAGVPGFMIGRNDTVAWGITNNLCSTRDLFAGESEGVPVRTERIDVRDGSAMTLEVRATPSGTVVTHLLDAPFDSGSPVSLRWTGQRPSDEIGALLAMQRAQTTDEFRRALDPWECPTWNFTVCDTRGEIAYQCAGAIPLRGRGRRGIRLARNPRDVWQSLVTTPSLPSFASPPDGRIVTANNRIDRGDRVTEQNGFWVSSVRADRIHEMLADKAGSPQTFARIQADVVSAPAAGAARTVVDAVTGDGEQSDLVARNAALLADWDGSYNIESTAATVFEAFWRSWVQAVVSERFSAADVSLMAPRAEPFAHWLLMDGGGVEWFARTSVADVVRACFEAAVKSLARELGDDASTWTWGRLHTWPRDVGADRGFAGCGVALPGGRNTVNNSHHDVRSSYAPTVLAANRVIADIGRGGGLLSASCTGNREHGEPSATAFGEWLRGDYHELWLSEAQLEEQSATRLVLEGRAQAAVDDSQRPMGQP